MAAISPFLALGMAAAIAMVVVVAMRIFGRMLERAGASIERRRREPPPEDKPYDPFAT